LDDQSSYQLVTRQEKPPWFPINTIGKPRDVWPTFVSFPRAHAFQGDGPSLVYCHASATWDEPSPEEKEKVMGFQIGTTSYTKGLDSITMDGGAALSIMYCPSSILRMTNSLTCKLQTNAPRPQYKGKFSTWCQASVIMLLDLCNLTVTEAVP